MQTNKISLQSFSLLSVIGKGSYAKVVLVKKIVLFLFILNILLGYLGDLCNENYKKEETSKK